MMAVENVYCQKKCYTMKMDIGSYGVYIGSFGKTGNDMIERSMGSHDGFENL